MLKIGTLVKILFIFIISFTYVNANEINDKAALNGIKEAKSVFLIDFSVLFCIAQKRTEKG